MRPNEDSSTKFTILLIEDDRNLNRLIGDFLQDHEGYRVIRTEDGLEALDLALTHLPDVILLDLNLPDIHGFKVIEVLKKQPLTTEIPIIIISATSDTDSIVYGLRNGAQDFLIKPFELREIQARIEVTLELHRLKAINNTKIRSRNPIFISYKRDDWNRFVNPLVNLLEAEGLPIWVDQHLIEASADWLDEINKGLKIASCLIVCVSPEAMESRYVKMEYRYAFNNGKRIYPLICRKADLPAELQIVQHYAYADVNKLIEELKRK